ncbi:MAG: serine hydrolase [Alphaproteobacteria bacterium]|nr:serine hydrolase [Alphaproteobacteria bacterium]
MIFVKFWRGLSAGALSLFCALTAVAADAPVPTSTAPAAVPAPQQPPHELTANDVEAFLDGLIPLQIGMDDIAGATVSIVKDGKLLFTKGYGFADMKTRKPVVADKTLFRVGSITKLFTWTAVMQLVEQGKVDLDADVATYIDFDLPKPFGKPITLRNLMTHRPGWEDVYKELGAKDAKTINLEAYLKEHVPAQIFAPGAVPAYSNYGAALAGYIVQRVSGEAFDQYVEDHILKPLGMTHSTLRQPLPDALKSDMSNGYTLGSADKASAFENVNAYPAGSMSATASDMARFMIAQLNDGELDGARILKTETAQEMHNTRLEVDSHLPAMALGFYEETRNGHRIIGHGGDTVVFHSDLHLIPDQHVGFFVSYNSAGRGDSAPRGALWRAFLDRYFPYTQPDQPTLATAKDDAQKVIGTYRSSRRGETSWTRLLGVLGEATVSADSDGILTVDAFKDINGQPRKWREVEPFVYRNVVGQERIVFKPDASGTMNLFIGVPIALFQRVGPLDSQWTIATVAGGSLLIMALTLLLWPAAVAARWHYGAGLPLSGFERLLRFGTYAVCAADIAFLIGFLFVVLPALQTIFDLDRTLDAKIHPWQYVGIAGSIGALIAVVNALVAWRSENRSFFGRVKETVIALACVGFAWFAWSMHLLDLGLRY